MYQQTTMPDAPSFGSRPCSAGLPVDCCVDLLVHAALYTICINSRLIRPINVSTVPHPFRRLYREMGGRAITLFEGRINKPVAG